MLFSVFFTAMLSAFSCSGFFDNGRDTDNDINLSPLAMADYNGYLSTVNYNEITPFLYRDTNSGRAWLFFSSDRDGNYNIYCAEMNSDGKFFNLKKLTNAINTSANEISPVIFTNYVGNTYTYLSLYISYIQISNYKTNIYTALLDDNFNIKSEPYLSFSTNATHISILNKNEFAPYMLVSLGTNFILRAYFDYYTTTNWSSFSSNFTYYGSASIYGADGFYAPEPFYGRLYLLDCAQSPQYSWYYGAIWNTNGEYTARLTNFTKIPSYACEYDEGWPCVDLLNYKVYFSSKRHGKGNWDLYRYNLNTLTNNIQWNWNATNEVIG